MPNYLELYKAGLNLLNNSGFRVHFEYSYEDLPDRQTEGLNPTHLFCGHSFTKETGETVTYYYNDPQQTLTVRPIRSITVAEIPILIEALSKYKNSEINQRFFNNLWRPLFVFRDNPENTLLYRVAKGYNSLLKLSDQDTKGRKKRLESVDKRDGFYSGRVITEITYDGGYQLPA